VTSLSSKALRGSDGRHLQDILIRLEPVLVVLAAFSFFRSKSAQRLPAVATYLVVRLVSLAYLEVVYNLRWDDDDDESCALRGVLLWLLVTYVAITVSVFFVVQEVFKRVMEPVPGLRRLGLMAFRWISVVSIVVAVGAVALPNALAPHGQRQQDWPGLRADDAVRERDGTLPARVPGAFDSFAGPLVPQPAVWRRAGIRGARRPQS
jgi:uncharacterized membrane protein